MKNIFCLLFIIVLLSACQKNVENITTIKPLWPLSIGNTWNYSVKTYTNQGTSFTTSSNTLKVISSTQYGGNTYYNISGLSSMLRNIDNNTIESYDGSTKPTIAFKIASVEGEKITTSINSTTYGSKAIQVINGYSCLRNTEVSNGSIYRDSVNYFFSSGIGLVKIEGWQINFNTNKGYYLTSIQDLNSFTVN